MIAPWDGNLQWGRARIFPCDRRINNLIASPNYPSWADTDRNLLLMNLASASVWFRMTRLLSGRWGVWELSSLWGLQSLILMESGKGSFALGNVWKCSLRLRGWLYPGTVLPMNGRYLRVDILSAQVMHFFFLASPSLGERLTWVSLVPQQLSFWMPVLRDQSPPPHPYSLLDVKGLTTHI